MFWKLVKYELQSVRLWYLGIYGLAIILSFPLGFMIKHMVTSLQQSQTGPTPLFVALLTLLVIAFIVAVGAVFIATTVLIIRRFAVNIYGREGYLTNTLPVNTHQLILSKLLPAFIWNVLSGLVVLICALIVLGISFEMRDFLLVSGGLGLVFDELGGLPLYSLNLIISAITSIMLYYCCISIGNLFNNYKVVMGFVAYFAITSILSLIGVFIGIGFGTLVFEAGQAINPMIYVYGIIQNLILIAIYYAGTYYILNKRLNLS